MADLFHLAQCLQGSSRLYVRISSLILNNIQFYKCIYYILLIHSYIRGHLLIVLLENRCAVSVGVLFSFLGVHTCKFMYVLLDLMVILYLIFWGVVVLFSTAAALFYIPAGNAQGFRFLHILTNACYLLLFDNIHTSRCEVESYLGFNLHFPYN